MRKRVVVTGVGVVSSLGIGKNAFWNSLIEGKSGISRVTSFDTSRFKRHYAGEIKYFYPGTFIPQEMIKFLGRASQLAIAATKLALRDAEFTLTEIRQKKVAVLAGTTMADSNVYDFSSEMFLREEWDEIGSKLLLNVFAASIPRNTGYFLKASGENILIPNACAAGNYVIGYGFDLIRKGDIDVAIVGGADSLSRIAFQGFQRLYAMAPKECSPFDRERKGMLLGEGSGVLILESLKSAHKRNKNIYAEILGYGTSCDARHMTIPNRNGIKKAMVKALKSSGVSPKKVDYISAHGTGTVQNDKNESGAIKETFEPRHKKIPVSSIKSMLGHCMGAASALEAVACCLALTKGVIPPTINHKTPDPECDIDCVPNQARKANPNIVLNNGFAFGGNNCCVVMKRHG